MSRDSVPRVLLVSAGVAFFCSLLVTSAVVYLRPMQLAWAELGRNRLVLQLAGLLPEGAAAPDRLAAQRFRELEVVLIDLASGQTDDSREPLTYDPRDSRILAREGLAIPAEADLAKLGTRAPLAPVYLRVEDGALVRLVLPLWGQGMWAQIEAYIALEGDCNSVAGFAVYAHGETPGIGDRIEQVGWQASWTGLRVADAQGRVLLSSPDGSREGYDAISGATVTVTAVGRMARYWLGEQAFGPFLARCRAGEEVWR